jgi:hypothetical protein
MITLKEAKRMQKEALKGSLIRQKLKNGTFYNKNNSFYINDMYCDTKIYTFKCNRKLPRIGKKYQVEVKKWN